MRRVKEQKSLRSAEKSVSKGIIAFFRSFLGFTTKLEAGQFDAFVLVRHLTCSTKGEAGLRKHSSMRPVKRSQVPASSLRHVDGLSLFELVVNFSFNSKLLVFSFADIF